MLKYDDFSFFKFYIITSLLITIIFFITPNPYAALHSGEILITDINSEYLLPPAFIIIIALGIMVVYYQRNIVIDFKLLLSLILLLVTGLYTGSLFFNPLTYIFNILSFTLCFSLASYLANKNEELSLKKIKRFVYYLNILFFLGIIFALLFPYRYGILPLEFSRVTRGEITLWNFTSLTVIYSSLMIATYHKYKLKYPIIIWIIMFIIILSTVTRAATVVMLIPPLIYIFMISKPLVKIFVSIISFLLITLFNKQIFTFLVGGDELSDITSGRDVLWSFHWKSFLENPLIGNGANFQNRVNYDGKADSEIGVLKMFSEYGIIYGFIMSFFIIIAVIIAIRIIVKINEVSFIDLFIALLFISILPNTVQDYSRILDVESLLFWLSVFYLNIKSRNIFPYLSLKKQ